MTPRIELTRRNSRRGKTPAEVAAFVQGHAAACLRYLEQRPESFPMPEVFHVRVRATGQRSNGGIISGTWSRPVIGINIDTLGEGISDKPAAFREYASIAKDPEIGRMRTADGCTEAVALSALVAHEVAHAAHHAAYHANRLSLGARPDWCADRKPHGATWQWVYRLLRRELVNPYLQAEPVRLAASPEQTTNRPSQGKQIELF